MELQHHCIWEILQDGTRRENFSTVALILSHPLASLLGLWCPPKDRWFFPSSLSGCILLKDWLEWSMKPVFSAFLQEPQLWHSKERENLLLFCKENFGLHGGPHLMPHKSYGVWKTTKKNAIKAVSSDYPQKQESWVFLAVDLLKAFQNNLKMKCTAQNHFLN